MNNHALAQSIATLLLSCVVFADRAEFRLLRRKAMLERMSNRHPISRLDELLPWNSRPSTDVNWHHVKNGAPAAKRHWPWRCGSLQLMDTGHPPALKTDQAST